jgi:hypothetical protein
MFRLMMASNDDHRLSDDQLIEDCVSGACHQVVQDLVQGPMRLLIHQMESPAEEACLHTLTSILGEAARLAVLLWSQRPMVQCLWLDTLLQERFQVDSPLLQAHPVHKLDDSNDRRLDGQPVRLVVRPAVRRMGTHEGESYSQSKVWVKAVVLVEAGNRAMVA